MTIKKEIVFLAEHPTEDETMELYKIIKVYTNQVDELLAENKALHVQMKELMTNSFSNQKAWEKRLSEWKKERDESTHEKHVQEYESRGDYNDKDIPF